MDKKEYCSPELDVISFRLQDVILGSPEDFNDYLDDGNDDWNDPLLPGDDEEIDW